MYKKVVVFLLVAVMTLAVFACSQPAAQTGAAPEAAPEADTAQAGTEGDASKTESEAETVKFGLCMPLTGDNATAGQFYVDGAKFMVEQINKNGGIESLGGAKIELVIEDNQSDATQVSSVLERLASDQEVLAVEGCGSSALTIPALATMEKIGIPLMCNNAGPSITQSGYTYIFQTSVYAAEVGETQIAFLNWLRSEKNYNTDKVGIIYSDNDYGVSSAEGSKDLAESAGLDVVYYQSFPVTMSDASSLITGLKNSGAEAVFITADTQPTKLIVNAMQSMNYYPVIVGGGSGFLLPSFADELGDSVIGLCSTSEFSYNSKNITGDDSLNVYVDAFHDEYGYYPVEVNFASMTHVLLFKDALERCAVRDRDAIRDALMETDMNTFVPGGNEKFDEYGKAVNAINVVIQWTKDENNEMVQSCVFPEEFAGSEFLDQRAG